MRSHPQLSVHRLRIWPFRHKITLQTRLLGWLVALGLHLPQAIQATTHNDIPMSLQMEAPQTVIVCQQRWTNKTAKSLQWAPVSLAQDHLQLTRALSGLAQHLQAVTFHRITRPNHRHLSTRGNSVALRTPIIAQGERE